MKLRFKILSSFLALALMLCLASIWSIYVLNNIGASANKLLRENYRSINSANIMIEALEREDSGILLLMLGKWKEGRTILNSADSLFWSGYNTAYNNLTISGEKNYLEAIKRNYINYKQFWDQPIVSTSKEKNLNWYFEDVHLAFLDTKSAVNKLMSLNSDTMYETSTEVKNQANRAIMPGIIAMIAAIVFALLFFFFINHYIVNPITKINNSIDEFLAHKHPIDIEIDSNDEISDLSSLVMRLSARVK